MYVLGRLYAGNAVLQLVLDPCTDILLFRSCKRIVTYFFMLTAFVCTMYILYRKGSGVKVVGKCCRRILGKYRTDVTLV